MLKRKGIALLITLFFIMMITISIGIGLKQVQSAAQEVKKEDFMIQTSVILDDVMQLLNSSRELSNINSSDELQMIFDMISFPVVPLGDTNLKVGIELSSARSKFNINSIADKNTTLKDSFENYLGLQMISLAYLDMVEDVIVGIRKDGVYKTGIFYDKPNLFRDSDSYITSLENLQEINSYYKKTYNNDKIDIIKFQNIFTFVKDSNYSIDINCASPNNLKILDLYIEDNNNTYEEVKSNDDENDESFCSSELCDSLDDAKKESLQREYRATCTPQMHIDVVIDIMDDNSSATIRFEYDIKTKKGSNFAYEI